MAAHVYKTKLTWTGNQGEGTSGYKAYTRDYGALCNIARSVNFPVGHEATVTVVPIDTPLNRRIDQSML